MKKLYVVDAVNFLFRSYYAIAPMTNAGGESTHALFGFIRSLFKLIKEFHPSHFVAVFDGPDSKGKRTSIYSEYKSHRKAMPADLFPQLEKALQFCHIAGIPFLSTPGVEADDVMGSIAKWAESKEIEVYLCSSDKDLCQLVSDKVFVINPHKNNLLIDSSKVKELFGITPQQMIDFLALTGDASDNIPGVEGFGPKTAAALLQEFGTLEELLAYPEKVSGMKKQEALKNHSAIALMSKQLATILTDVEFPKKEEFFLLKQPDTPALKTFYQEMRFSSLLKELEEEKVFDIKTSLVSYHLIDEEEALQLLIERLLKEKELCIDTETTDVRPLYAELVGIGVGIRPKEAWYIPLNGKLGKEKVLAALRTLFAAPHLSFFGHNLKYDLHVLRNVGITVSSVFFDTLLASYLLRPHLQKHNLDELVLEKFGVVKTPITALIGKGKEERTMDLVPKEMVCSYCCEDVDYTCRLKELFSKELEKENLFSVFSQIELPLLPILFSMERTGIFVDLHILKTLSQELSKHLSSLQEEIFQSTGETFNLNSPKQLSHVLFEKLGIKPPKKTATGYSTSAEVLEELKETSPVVEEILRYRALEKLRSTYVDALPFQVFPKTQRIHCTFNQSVAATGRLSCQDPNLQNIPLHSTEGRKIRSAFRPDTEELCFASADYSQIELRLLAHLSEDPSLLKAFQEGEDIHTFTASLVYNIALSQVTSEMRQKAKAVNYGIVYGQQAFGLSKGLSIDYKEAEAFIDTYFQRYPRVRDFLEHCKQSARDTGFALTMYGRKRPIPEIHSKNPQLRAFAERLAINTPLQGSAADLIKCAMIQIDTRLKKTPYGIMLLQIHDELLFETKISTTHPLISLVKEVMEKVFTLKVPLSVDVSIGKNWEECYI